MNLILRDNVQFGKFCVLGCKKEADIWNDSEKGKTVLIGDNVIFRNNVIVYEGTVIQNNTYIDDFSIIGYDCIISNNVRITYGAYICDRVVIGESCVIAGFICDAVRIGKNSTIMGELVHEYSSPNSGWWDGDEEPAPIIGNNVVIGYGSKVIGGVIVGDYSYIAAGAIVSKNVPSYHIVTGTNHMIPLKDWKGKRLKNLISTLNK